MTKSNEDTTENCNTDFKRIAELISKYERMKKSGKIKTHTEEEKYFILPLFRTLCWNVYNRGKIEYRGKKWTLRNLI